MDVWEKRFRSRTLWILFLIVAYIITGVIATHMIVRELMDFLMPMTLWLAPIGLVFWIEILTKQNVLDFFSGNWVVLLIIHLAFWSFFIYFLKNIKKLERKTLFKIAIVIFIIVILTASGCTLLFRGLEGID